MEQYLVVVADQQRANRKHCQGRIVYFIVIIIRLSPPRLDVVRGVAVRRGVLFLDNQAEGQDRESG